MNKLLLFLVLLLSTAMPVIYAATPDVIVKKVNFHYDLDDFSILIKEGTVEVRPASFSSAFPEGGEPAIPVFRTRLEVPSCSFCHIDTIQSENWVMVAENVQLLEEGYPLIGSSKNLPVRKVYENHEPIVPMQQVRIATLNNHPDNGFILLETYPFIYDTSTHSIYFTPDITVVISILVSDIAGKISHQATVSLEELTIDQDGSNGDQLDPLKLGGGYDILPDPIYPDPVDYVIITNKKLAPHFQKLLEWKRQKGLHAEILTIDDLGSIDYPEELARSIKSWLDQNRQERGLAYALIGGDVNIVPAVNCYAPVKTGVDTYYSPGIPTDLYYACHKGNLNWDKNSNGKKGEADDDIEFHQDILVSRIPVFNQETVEIVTEKIIDYEKNGKVNMSLLQTGSELFGEVAEGIPDAQLIALTLYNQSIAPYWNGTRTEVFNSVNSPTPNKPITPETLIDQFSKGYGFINVESHGNPEGWILDNGEIFNKTHCSNIINAANYTFISTNACFVNCYFTGIRLRTSLSHALITYPHTGVIGLWASTREGWGTYTIGEPGPSQMFENAFFKALFQNPSENKNLGKMAAWARWQFLNSGEPTGAIRWLLYSMNTLGDPETPLFTTIPKNFTNVTTKVISPDKAEIYSGEHASVICLSGTKNGEPYYQISRNYGGANEFDLTPENLVLTITKQNFLPFIVIGKENILKLGQQQSSQNKINVNLLSLEENGISINLSLMPTTTRNQVCLITDIIGTQIRRYDWINETEDQFIALDDLSSGYYTVTLYRDGVVVEAKRIMVK